MNYSQGARVCGAPPGRERPEPALRPFTRAHNDLYDRVKPELNHKVDRCVLDALVRQLEGFHRVQVALTILQLAGLAAVSPWSVTKALGRLEEAGIIRREKRKLTQSGRFIWQISLADAYRVVPPKPADKARPRGPRTDTLAGASPPEPAVAKAAPPPAPAAAAPEPEPVPDTLADVADATPPEPAGAKAALPPATPTPELEPVPALLSPEPGEDADPSFLLLRSLGIDSWKAGQLAATHTPELIRQTLAAVKYRGGTVRNPAAWVIRELERGGYEPPAALLEQAQRREEQAARAERQRQREEQEAQAELARQQSTAQLLESYARLSPERQEELLQEVRQQLRTISPRLAGSPLDLSQPGPVRSQLLELLAQRPELRTAGPTPRSGGWQEFRAEADRGGPLLGSPHGSAPSG